MSAPRKTPWIVVAAHPGDETIGATWFLRHAPGLLVVHATDGAPTEGRLRSPSAPPSRVHSLTPAERALKRRMLDCFERQAQVLCSFDVAEERFRRAPADDFTWRPNPRPLHYETLGWMRGEGFCRAAKMALAELAADRLPLSQPARRRARPCI